MKLIDQMNQFHKFLSVQATVIGGVLVSVVVANPAAASEAIGGWLPPIWMPFVTIAVTTVVTLIARAKAQPKLSEVTDNDKTIAK